MRKVAVKGLTVQSYFWYIFYMFFSPFFIAGYSELMEFKPESYLRNLPITRFELRF